MHYDYAHRSVAGLGGFAEDALATAIKQIGGGKTRATAWNLFRFGTADLSEAEIDRRVKNHDVTMPFNVVFEGMKPFLFPLAVFTSPKDLKTDEKEAIHADLYKKWKDAWKQVAPKPPATRKSGREALDRAKKQKDEARKAAYKLAVSQKASADAATGKYDPPPTEGEPKPGENPALRKKKSILLEYRKQYDSEWTAATGKPPPSSASMSSMSSAGGRGEVPSSKFPVVPALAVAGVVAVLLLRKK